MTKHRGELARWRRAPHLDLISDAIVAAIRGEIPPLIVIEMPPRHGKSEFISRTVPGWFLDLFPHKRVLLASYSGDFAAAWGRTVRDDLAEFANQGLVRVKLSRSKRQANEWVTTRGGGMKSAGIGGSLTGRGAHLFIIDDPIKDMEEANSPTMRQKLWDWWQSVAFTRQEPGCIYIVLHTRWNEDDLIGRLIKDTGQPYYELRLPAVAEEEDPKQNIGPDPLGRQPGQALWPWRYDDKALNRIRVGVGPYVWASLYQQRPMPLEGNLFKRVDFRYWHRDPHSGFIVLEHDDDERNDEWVDPKSLRRFVTTDLSIKETTTSDFTCMGHWGYARSKGHLILLSAIHEKMDGSEHQALIRRQHTTWKPAFFGIESAAYQATVVQAAIKKGLPARELKPEKDKVTRAIGATPYFAAHVVWFPADPDFDIDDYEKELITFPNATHDDWVDMTSYAAHVIQQPWFLVNSKLGEEAIVGSGKQSYWLGAPA